MSLMRRFRWKDEKGVETEYDLGAKASNVVQDATHRFVTDEEKAAWNAKQESGSDTKTNVITFTAATERENIQSGETQGTIMGKIHKFFADLKEVAFSGSYTDLSNKPTIGTAASYAVANNDTTTAAGYIADARIVRAHGLEIDQLISDLTAADGEKFRYGKTADGQRGIIITGEDGADTVIPFSIFREAAIKYIESSDGTSYIVYASSVGCGHADNKTLQYMSFAYSDSKSTYTVKAIISGYYTVVSSSGSMSKNYYAAGSVITTFTKYSKGAVIAL